MAGTAEDELVFENEEWLVTGSGLEHKRTGYFIERESLGDRRGDGLWSWPLHMAEKQWCTPAPFAEAFTCAAAVHGAGFDPDLARSFRAARCEIVGWPKSLSEPVRTAATTLPDALREDRSAPISWKPPRTNDPMWNRAERKAGSASHSAGYGARERAPARSRFRGASMRGMAAWEWRASRPIRRASTQLVRLLQAAFSRA